MPENEKSFIEQEEAKMERRQFFKVSAKYGFTTAVVAAAGSSLMSVWGAGLSFALNPKSGPSVMIVLFNFEKRHKDFVFKDLEKVGKQRSG